MSGVLAHMVTLDMHTDETFIWNAMLLLLPIIDLLQQFEDYVKGIALVKKNLGEKSNNN
jgi:hypothetical protein